MNTSQNQWLYSPVVNILDKRIETKVIHSSKQQQQQKSTYEAKVQCSIASIIHDLIANGNFVDLSPEFVDFSAVKYLAARIKPRSLNLDLDDTTSHFAKCIFDVNTEGEESKNRRTCGTESVYIIQSTSERNSDCSEEEDDDNKAVSSCDDSCYNSSSFVSDESDD